MTDPLDRLAAALAHRYTIERELGAGGMATVYLAHDIKHDRKVAIKVLRPELAAVLGAERFVQEIKTTANLQHPHILPLFDSGQAVVPPLRGVERGTGGEVFLYYVMPYVEGETLRDKLNREKQLGIDEAVKITTEVADALDYAHRHNVIHRDIKPENILLHDGRPMVADFGIALAVSAAAGGRMTETGLSLGTPHYMSPEQATAEKDLTNRSDIYSLGAVLYEMLSGEPPHMGNSAQQIIMKIVTDEARPLTELRKSVPANVAAATARSLEKLAADRFASAAKFAEALTNPSFTLPTTPGAAAGASTSKMWNRLSAVLAVGTLLFLLTTVWSWLRRPSEASHDVARYVAVAESELLDGMPMLLPDGSEFFFVARVRTGSREAEASGILAQGGRRLYRRKVGTLKATPLLETVGLQDWAVSPDGKWVAFIRKGRLYRMARDGGPATALGMLDVVKGGLTWLTEESLFAVSPSRISRVDVKHGTAVPYGAVDASRTQVRWPAALPDGRGVLVTLVAGDIEEAQLAVLTSDESEPKVLVERGTHGRYTRNGYLLYARSDGSLNAVAFDLGTLETRGLAAPVLSGVAVDGDGRAHFSVSNDGTLLYMTAAQPTRTMVLVDRNGGEQIITADPNLYSEPRYSPDGRRIAVSILDGDKRDIWIWDTRQTTLTKLTHGGDDRYPQWSPNGNWIAYASYRDGISDLFVRAANGTGDEHVLDSGGEGRYPSAWTSDSRRVIAQVVKDSKRDLVAFPIDSIEEPAVFLREDWQEFSADMSPDGRWVAYVSDESGRLEVYVRGFPDTGNKTQISTGGATEPRWAQNGREVFYRTTDGRFVAARVGLDSMVTVFDRVTLFRDQYVRRDWMTSYDVRPDGEGFLFVRTMEDNEPDLILGDLGRSELIVVLNFFEELKAKVGRE